MALLRLQVQETRAKALATSTSLYHWSPYDPTVSSQAGRGRAGHGPKLTALWEQYMGKGIISLPKPHWEELFRERPMQVDEKSEAGKREVIGSRDRGIWHRPGVTLQMGSFH